LEFNHRYNQRKVTDGERTLCGLQKMEGKRLTYKTPIAKDGLSKDAKNAK